MNVKRFKQDPEYPKKRDKIAKISDTIKINHNKNQKNHNLNEKRLSTDINIKIYQMLELPDKDFKASL